MNRDERLAKIESIECMVCGAQPGQQCIQPNENPCFHVGRGQAADALYDAQSDLSADILIPYSIFGAEELRKQLPREMQLIGRLAELVFLQQATLDMIRSDPDIWALCEERIGIEKGWVYRAVEGDEDTPTQIERLRDPNPDPNEKEYTVAEVIDQQYTNRVEAIVEFPELFGII